MIPRQSSIFAQPGRHFDILIMSTTIGGSYFDAWFPIPSALGGFLSFFFSILLANHATNTGDRIFSENFSQIRDQ